jgi:uncharacterized protein (DUF924 family)
VPAEASAPSPPAPWPPASWPPAPWPPDRAILDFWFSPAARKRWFDADEAFDQEIAARFGQAWRRVAGGDLAGWPNTADGTLALVILLDQFPRNLFRGDPRAYATDQAARTFAAAALAHGLDAELPPERRRFLYLPFMHSEDVIDQRRCVALFAGLDDAESLDFARRHLAIVERFGRFPHRNAALGRETTAEEAAFLKEPGSSF